MWSWGPEIRITKKIKSVLSARPYQKRTLARRFCLVFQVVDDDTYFEIMPEWAKNITVGFARMEGHPVGIVGNNPLFLAGCLDIDTSTKASLFHQEIQLMRYKKSLCIQCDKSVVQQQFSGLVTGPVHS